jgi:hypothetical protein
MQKQVDVQLAGKNILKSSLNAANNCQTYHRRCCWCCCCIPHRRYRCLNLSPVQAPSLLALPLLCTVVSLLCLLILAIPLYSSTNNMSWIDYYYSDDVNTMDAFIVSTQMVLIDFVLYMVGGVYVWPHARDTAWSKRKRHADSDLRRSD